MMCCGGAVGIIGRRYGAAGTLVTGVAGLEHQFVGCSKRGTVLVVDCLFDVCQGSCIDSVENSLEVHNFAFRSLRRWVKAEQPSNASARFVVIKHRQGPILLWPANQRFS